MLTPALVCADWHQASGENFVVYADQPHKKILKYAQRLERYHAALTSLIGDDGLTPSPSNRVSVYVVNNRSQVKKLHGADRNRYVLGFYQPRAGGSLAIVPRATRAAKSEAALYEQTLLHEYAHHFMFSHNKRLLPRWYSEGFAEFFSTVKFKKDGAVLLGRFSVLRRQELNTTEQVPLQEIFDIRLYEKNKGRKYDNFYGRSWLLYHYLYFSTERRGQARDYITRLQQGVPALEAANAAFGPLDVLDDDMKAYLRIPKHKFINVPPEKLMIEPVRVKKLSEGQAAMMPVIMRSRRGVNQQQADELLPQARQIAAEYPGDVAVLAALAEAEVDADNFNRAIAVADSALAIDATNIDAHMQKGYAMARLAQTVTDGKEKSSSWKAVRRQFVKANRLEPENPLPLVHFYRSYIRQGIEPTKNAVEGLEWALSLAPFDRSVRALAASQQMKDERFARARETLVPLAYDPHQDADNPSLALLKLAEQKMAEQSEAAAADTPQ